MRLGKAESGHVLALRGGRQEGALLFLTAEEHNWCAAETHVRRVGQCRRAASARDLLDRDGGADAVAAGAAVLFGERDAHQAQLTHLAERLGGELSGLIHKACARGDLLLGELAHRLADHALFFR